jgi:hypothetical protein
MTASVFVLLPYLLDGTRVQNNIFGGVYCEDPV